jgi:hypothetical protein
VKHVLAALTGVALALAGFAVLNRTELGKKFLGFA